MLLSVVSPVFQNDEHVAEFCQSLSTICEGLGVEYEIILVNDGSTDNSLRKMQFLASELPRIRVLNLSRNFGQHKAVMAGLARVRGQWVVILDSDMEEDPRHIPSLLKLSQKTNLPVQIIRRELVRRPLHYRILRTIFYRIFNRLSDITYTPNVSNYGCYPRSLIELVKASRTAYPFIPSLIIKYSPEIHFLEVDQSSSTKSRTTYTPRKLFTHAFNIVVNNSKKPLFFVAWMGLLDSTLSIAYGVFVLLEFLARGSSITGWTSLAILTSVGFSLTILSIGILAIYISTLLELAIDSGFDSTVEELTPIVQKKRVVLDDD